MSIDPVNPYAASRFSQVPEPLPKPSFTFRDVLGLGWRLYCTNFVAVAIVTMVIWAPLEVVQAHMEYFVFDPEDFRDSFRLQQFFDNVFGIIQIAGVTAIGGAAMRGERMSWISGLQEGLAAWPRMVWTRILYGFALV